MKKVNLSLLFIIIFTFNSFAQKIGLVLNENNKTPIPYASVFIKEKLSGIITDDKGQFILNLKEGKYNLEIRSLGFTAKHIEITIEKKQQPITIYLKPTSYNIREAIVVGGVKKEDPAYRIIRNLISRVPIYRKMIEHYKNEAYTKGSVKISKIPFLLRNIKIDGVAARHYIGKRFVVEHHIGCEFNYPSNYKQTVFARRSSAPFKQGEDTSEDIAQKGVYYDNIGAQINPIGSQGLKHYEYRLVGSQKEGEHLVHCIDFFAKKNTKNSESKGQIYVIDGQWALYKLYAELKMSSMISQNIDVSLSEISDNVYMPVTFNFDINVSMLGLGVNYRYYTSIKYDSISIKKDIFAMLNSEENEGENMDVYKQVKELNHKLDTIGKKIENKYYIPITNTISKTELSPLADKRDSTYWNTKISAPLSKEEKLSYIKADSIKEVFEKKKTLFKKDSERAKKGILDDILFGRTYKIKNNWKIGFDGLSSSTNRYDYGNGLYIGQGFTIKTYKSKSFNLNIRPEIYYATKSRNIFWDIDSKLKYNYKKMGFLNVSFGFKPMYIGYNNSALTNFNTFITSLDGRGFLNLYNNKYIKIYNEIEVTNGLILKTGISYNNISTVEESNISSIFNPFYRSLGNMNKSKEINHIRLLKHKSFKLSGELSLNTKPYYTISQITGKKRYVNNDYNPLFINLRYETAIPLNKSQEDNYSSYHLLSLNLHQDINIGWFSKLSYNMSIGRYIKLDNIFADDKIYTKAYNSIVVFNNNNQVQLFTMPELSAFDRNFAIGEMKFNAPKILINLLPISQLSLYNETFSIKAYNNTAIIKNSYIEGGYIYGLGDAIGIGIYYGKYIFKNTSGSFAFRLNFSL